MSRKIIIHIEVLLNIHSKLPTEKVIEELDYDFSDGTKNGEVTNTEIFGSENTQNGTKLKISLSATLEDEIEVSHFVQELDYEFSDTTGQAEIVNSKILDYSLQDSK